MKVSLAAIAVFIALLLAACGDPQHWSRTEKGALIGGALGTDAGALIGYANGAPVTGAAVGAGLGALGGTAIGAGLEKHSHLGPSPIYGSPYGPSYYADYEDDDEGYENHRHRHQHGDEDEEEDEDDD